MESEPRQTYNYDDFILTRVNKFKEIYQRVREHMQQYSQDLKKQHNKGARTIKIQPDNIVMIKLHTPVGNSNKLSPQFKGPYKVIAPDTGNKFKIRHLETGDVSVRHADELEQTHINNYEENKEIQDSYRKCTNRSRVRYTPNQARQRKPLNQEPTEFCLALRVQKV